MKRILLLVFWCSASLWADAQALLGTTGLLHAPTADMQRDKTFLFGGNYLNTHPLSTHFRSREVGYTFNYYINITMFPLAGGVVYLYIGTCGSRLYLFPGTVLGEIHESGPGFQCASASLERRVVEGVDSANRPWSGRSHLSCRSWRRGTGVR